MKITNEVINNYFDSEDYKIYCLGVYMAMRMDEEATARDLMKRIQEVFSVEIPKFADKQ